MQLAAALLKIDFMPTFQRIMSHLIFVNSIMKKIHIMTLAGVGGILLAVTGIVAMYTRETLGLVPLISGLAGLLVGMITILIALNYFHKEDATHPVILSHKPTLNLIQLVMIVSGLAAIAWAVFLGSTQPGFYGSIRNGLGAGCMVIAGVYFIYFAFDVARTAEHPGFRNRKSILFDYLVVFAVPVVAAGWSVYRLYSEEAGTVTIGEADFTLKPAALIGEFEKDAEKANATYIGKSVRFSSSVIELAGDSTILVKLNSWKGEYTVNCNFDKAQKEKLASVLPGDSLEVQCSCSGLTKPSEEMSLLSESSLDMTRCNLLKWYQNKPNIGTDVEHPEGRDTQSKK